MHKDNSVTINNVEDYMCIINESVKALQGKYGVVVLLKLICRETLIYQQIKIQINMG